ncbi:hypothetical protein JL720_1390 [Aureococcus anophagefferens]|nr:hypothetical protein JL720_1390 [Aureococcus anophagefferens]
MSDDEARTDTVDLLHSYPHHQPKTGSDFIESEYYTSLIYLAAIVGGIGVILLVVHALYRICLACRSCCCRRCCCTCVERWTKGRRGRMRLLLGFTLLGVCGGVLSWKAAEVELQRGVSNVADSLDTLQDFLGHLGDVTADMLKSTGKITEAASSIECSGSELDDYLDDVSYVNASVADVAAIFDDMIDPVDTAEDQVRSNGRRYVRLVVPVALAAPFALYVLFALCGVGVSKASRPPVSASCCMNTGAIWAGAVGLPVALVVLVVLLVLSVAFSDFCYTDVTSLDDAVESLATYADELEATGVCTGVADALDAIEAATEDLQASVDEITEDVLSCAYIQPIVEDLFYKALCDRTDADTAPETGVELADKGGDDVDVDEEAKAVDADVYAEAPSPKKKRPSSKGPKKRVPPPPPPPLTPLQSFCGPIACCDAREDDGAAPVEAVLVPAGDSFTYEAI